MQLVIDIPKDAYDYVMGSGYFPSNFNMIFEIRNGIPLPKGHGKLKDVDKIEWYGCTTELNCPYKDRECKDCHRAECDKTQVDDIPTIIPADEESEV